MPNSYSQDQENKVLIQVIVILLFSLLIYGITIINQFVYDDTQYISQNYQVKKLANIPGIFKTTFPPNEPNIAYYRPITISSYALDYWLWRGSPMGFHLTNICIHTANAILLYFIILSFIPTTNIAFFTALFFTIHPVHTEAVAWISGRADLLSSFFSFSAMLLYIKFNKSNAHHKFLYLLSSVILFGLGFLSKEMSVVVLPIMVLYDFMKQASEKRSKILRNLFKNIPYYLPYIILFIALFYLRYKIIDSFAQTKEMDVFSPQDTFWNRFFTMGMVGIKYLQLAVFPSILTIVYEFPVIRSPFTFLKIIPTLLFIFVGILGVFLLLFRSRKYVISSENEEKPNKNEEKPNESLSISPYTLIGFGIVWLYIALLPVMNIIPVGEFLAERYLYFPSAGYCLGYVVLLWALSRKKVFHNIIHLTIIVLLLYFSVLLIYKNTVWYNNKTLWRYEVSLHPKSAKALNGYGIALTGEGRISEAIYSFKRAVSIDGRFYLAYNNLGVCYTQLKQYGEAEKSFKKSLSIYPNFIDAFINLGNVYIKAGKLEQAYYIFKGLENTYPDNSKVLLYMGYIYFKKSDFQKAEQIFNRVLQTSPDDYFALYYLGQIYKNKNDITKAKELFIKSEIANPEFSEVHFTLADIFANEKNHQKAINEYLLYLELDNKNAAAHYNLANELLLIKEANSAEKHYKYAIRLDPQLVGAYVNLGTLYVLENRKNMAQKQWEKALQLDPNNKNAKENLAKLLKR